MLRLMCRHVQQARLGVAKGVNPQWLEMLSLDTPAASAATASSGGGQKATPMRQQIEAAAYEADGTGEDGEDAEEEESEEDEAENEAVESDRTDTTVEVPKMAPAPPAPKPASKKSAATGAITQPMMTYGFDRQPLHRAWRAGTLTPNERDYTSTFIESGQRRRSDDSHVA